MRRNLIHYWRINLAVLLGAAVATAVLTGALLVGDSVRGSLRDLTLDRLGKIDYALVSPRHFREELLVELAVQQEIEREFESMASAIITTATAVHAKSKSRASRINLNAVDEQFFSLYDSEFVAQNNLKELLRKQPEQALPSVIINQALQAELRAEIGDQVLLSFERPSDIARGSLLGNKGTEDVVESRRFTLTQIIPDRGPGRFSLQPNQNLTLNAYVSLPVLQRTLERKDQVNAVLVVQKSDAEEVDRTALLDRNLNRILRLDDLGLQYEELDGVLLVESNESILSHRVVDLIESVTTELQLPLFTSYVYLANKTEANGRLLPYSTVAAFDPPPTPPFQALSLTDGSPAPQLTEQEILLNDWAAKDLKVAVGDKVKMVYFGVGSRDELFEKETSFTVAGVVAMRGLGADSKITPDFPGIADADNMSDWDPPFPVDLGLIRPKDEEYWDQYRGTPKAFVSEAVGRALWGSRFGNVTSVRIAAAAGFDIQATQEMFANKLLEKARAEDFGLAFQPVKKQGLASSTGAINFAEYFVYFSFFLIVSAALLVGLLFRLGVEQRATEIGMLLAVGFPVKKIRRQFLSEGIFLAAIGTVAGLAMAVLYGWVLMVGLRTWWVAAVGTPFLFLHINPLSLLIGLAGSLLVILGSIWLGFRKVSKIPPPALLAGVTSVAKSRGQKRAARLTASLGLVLAILLTGLSFFVEGDSLAGIFFGAGTLLLISGLAFFSIWLRGKHSTLSAQQRAGMILRMSARNSPRSPGRSMLSAALVASACFVILSVESFRRDFGEELLKKDSGTGGYSLVAETDIPLHYDLNTEDGRFELGFSDQDSQTLGELKITPFRLLPGEDASCLNLYQVEKPRILGVTADQIARGGFDFQKVADQAQNGKTNPWTLLTQEIAEDVVPVFGDQNSVTYILHSGYGKDFVIENEFGRDIKLHFVGLLKKSIFQSELLMSEANFLKHFPSQNGYAYFLIETPPTGIAQSAQILESTLSDYGFDSSTTAEKLAAFQAVENTYLSTFQGLGGLGLILGTIGLGIILIRNVIERRGELASLRAFGYRRRTLALLVLGENGFLLLLGILIGGLSAIIAVAPHLIAGASDVPWLSLLVTLLLVFLVGMLASSAAVRAALRIPLLPALKAE